MMCTLFMLSHLVQCTQCGCLSCVCPCTIANIFEPNQINIIKRKFRKNVLKIKNRQEMTERKIKNHINE